MTNNTRTQLLRDIVSDLIARASEDQLAEAYYALRPEHKPSEPPPGAAPLTSAQIVDRALQRAGRPIKLRDVVALARIEDPTITKGAVSGALAKRQREGAVRRNGPPRSGEYSLALPDSIRKAR